MEIKTHYQAAIAFEDESPVGELPFNRQRKRGKKQAKREGGPIVPREPFDQYLYSLPEIKFLTPEQELEVGMQLHHSRSLFRLQLMQIPFMRKKLGKDPSENENAENESDDDTTIEEKESTIDEDTNFNKLQSQFSFLKAFLLHLQKLDEQNKFLNTESDEYKKNKAEEDDILKVIGISRQELEKQCAVLENIQHIFITAREKLIIANLPFVVSVIKEMYVKNLSLIEKVEEGNIGLVIAADRFDYRKGAAFLTYADYWIRQRILRANHDKSKLLRVPEHKKDLMTAIFNFEKQFLHENGRTPKPEEVSNFFGFEKGELKKFLAFAQETKSINKRLTIRSEASFSDFMASETEDVDTRLDLSSLDIDEILGALTERQREILKRRFGLNGPKQTQKEVAEYFGVFTQSIHNSEHSAISQLRKNEKLLGFLKNVLE